MNSSEIILEELRLAFRTIYASEAKYAGKTLAIFGAELALLLFYIANDEIIAFKTVFDDISSGWWLLALFAILAFLTSAVMFIITLAVDRAWQIPPDPDKLLSDDRFAHMPPDEVRMGLIHDYQECADHCIKKIRLMKRLSDIGIYFLVAGVMCLLLIKVFGV